MAVLIVNDLHNDWVNNLQLGQCPVNTLHCHEKINCVVKLNIRLVMTIEKFFNLTFYITVCLIYKTPKR